MKLLSKLTLATSVCLVFAALAWQAVSAGGNPDPLQRDLSPAAMVMSTSVLVFREGLEAILVLAAVTAGMSREKRAFARAIPVGAGVALLATVATWCLVVAVISEINASELALQAVTGLLAIVVLLVVMNWFFHKIYWTGWISHHNDRRRRVLSEAKATGRSPYLGLALLGFTAIYREGFEVVLFLQNLRLRAGTTVVFRGATIGLMLTGIVAVLTFIAHKRLPYKRMLISTGAMLGAVLLVMVGESVQEMQLAGWIPTTPIGVSFAPWLGLWFSLFANVEGLSAQAFAAALVIGSYYLAEHRHVGRRRRGAARTAVDFSRRNAKNTDDGLNLREEAGGVSGGGHLLPGSRTFRRPVGVLLLRSEVGRGSVPDFCGEDEIRSARLSPLQKAPGRNAPLTGEVARSR